MEPKRSSSEDALDYTSRLPLRAKILRTSLSWMLSVLPERAPQYIYTTLLKPKPLRALTDHLMQLILPSAVHFPEGILLLHSHDAVVSGAIALGVYERSLVALFRSVLKEGMTVVDIGANIGYYTLIAAAGVGSSGRVLAYEPEDENRSILNQMIVQNVLQNVTILSDALGDREEDALLHIHPTNKGKHSLLSDPTAPTTTVRVSTLDASTKALQIPRVDVVKIDVEGWEAKVLRGMRGVLQRDHPILFFEFSPTRIRSGGDDPAQCLTDLRTLGYQLSVLDEHSGTLVTLLHSHDKTLLDILVGHDDYRNIYAACL